MGEDEYTAFLQQMIGDQRSQPQGPGELPQHAMPSGSYLVGGSGFTVGSPQVAAAPDVNTVAPYMQDKPTSDMMHQTYGITNKAIPAAPEPPSAESLNAQLYQPPAQQFMTTSGGSSTRTVLDPKAQGAYDRTSAALRSAVEASTGAAQRIAGEEKDMYGKQGEAMAKHTKNYATLRSQAVKKMEPQEAKLLALVEKQATKEVDQDRWWSSRDASQKFGAVLGVLLGGLAEGISGGKVRNTAAQIVMKSIDQDIAVQKANIAKGAQDIQAQQGILNVLYRRVGDVDKAEHMARIGLATMAENEIKQAMATNKKLMSSYNGAVALSQLDQKKAASILQLTATRKTGTWSKKPVDPYAAQMRQLAMQGKVLDIQRKKQAMLKEGVGNVKEEGDGSYLEMAMEDLAHQKRIAEGGQYSPYLAARKGLSSIPVVGGIAEALMPESVEVGTEAARNMQGIYLAKAAGAGNLSDGERDAAAGTINGHNMSADVMRANIRVKMNLVLKNMRKVANRSIQLGYRAKAAYIMSQMTAVRNVYAQQIPLVIKNTGLVFGDKQD